MAASTVMIVGGIVLVISLGYLAWWAMRFLPYRSTVNLARKAARGELDGVELNKLVAHASMLKPDSGEFESACLALAKTSSADPRLKELLIRYFSHRQVTAANATAAARLAALLVGQSLAQVLPSESGNAASLLDQAHTSGLESAENDELRSRLAQKLVELSREGIEAGYRQWLALPDGRLRTDLTRFLFDYYSACMDVWGMTLPEGIDLSKASAVISAKADLPPADLAVRLCAIQASFACQDYITCFRQCEQARQEFGPAVMSDEAWSFWAFSVVALESGNWAGYARHEFAALPSITSWNRLLELFEQAHRRQPTNAQILLAYSYTLAAVRTPVAKALPVYEQVLDARLPSPLALNQLASAYYQQAAWPRLLEAASLLLELPDAPDAPQARFWQCRALLELGRVPEKHLLEEIFDEGHAFPSASLALARQYASQEKIPQVALDRMGRILTGELPPQLPREELQALREKFILPALQDGKERPHGLQKVVSAYLSAGGKNTRIMQWAAKNRVGDSSQQRAVLEGLIQHTPVDLQNCLSLAQVYRHEGASKPEIIRLFTACEQIWKEKPAFDAEDCSLAFYLDQEGALSTQYRQRLFAGLVTLKPENWREDAASVLSGLLRDNLLDVTTLDMALRVLFSRQDKDSLHIWTLEQAQTLRDEPVEDGLRLLSLYDAGLSRPGESAAQASSNADQLAARLASRCRTNEPKQRSVLFGSLFNRALPKGTDLQPWEIELMVFGAGEDLIPARDEVVKFLGKLGALLANQGNLHAVPLLRWVYENGQPGAEDGAALFSAAVRLNNLDPQDEFWFTLAGKVRIFPNLQAQAEHIQAEALVAASKWDKRQTQAALMLMDGPERKLLAPAFIRLVEYGRDHAIDRKILELLDEDPRRGESRADLLRVLAERRENRHDYEGALTIYDLVEKVAGSSEDLTRRILTVLPNTSQRAQSDERLAGYLKRYRNSYDLITLMTTLARDPSQPLSFDLAFAIIDRWGELAVHQGNSGIGVSVTPSFIITAKCEVYDLYQAGLSADDTRAILTSISQHSQEALNDEARNRVERIGEAVLNSSSQDPEVRLIVASILNNIGNLPGATWQYEQLVEIPEHHAEAIESLRRIARKLSSPRREVPALLTAYRYTMAEDFDQGKLDSAEEIARKAKAILVDPAVPEQLSLDERKHIQNQEDAVLKLYQLILEQRQKKVDLTIQQRRELADVYRLRGLWDQAGKIYTELALELGRQDDRAGAIEVARLVFDCYYKAGKSWWEPAARYLLRILWGREQVPSSDVVADFNLQELQVLEHITLLYHSLAADPNLLEGTRRLAHRRTAVNLYERLPLEYLQDREYLRQLRMDIEGRNSINEPFEYTPYIQEHGRAETSTATRYERLDRLGKGEFAEVYKVRDTQNDKLYAQKIIIPAKARDPEAVKRFLREGEWLRSMDHPNIVKCFDVGEQDGRYFLIMDFVDGLTLDQLIARHRMDIPLTKRLEIFLQVCSAVEFVHNQEKLHRDLHPNNVLVSKNMQEVKLTDFGLATVLDREGVGKSSRLHGRENYTPPEVYTSGRETKASEVYSLGAMLCYMLTGWPRLDAASTQELNSERYFGLGKVIVRALSNDPSVRYQRVTELIEAIRHQSGVSYDYGAILQKVTPNRFQQMFELTSELGRGQSGPVYRARDLRSDHAPDVAIKEIESQRVRGSIERRAGQFFRIRDMQHPNLVGLDSIFRVELKLYIVMEMVDGQSLTTLMEQVSRQSRRLPPARVLQLAGDIAAGLAFIHENNIIHGCVLPTNVLVESKGGRARISDFTAAVLFEGDQWHQSAMVRQYDYLLAPEVTQGKGVATPASDVYSLGWLLCYLATGRRGQMNDMEIFAALEESGQWSEPQSEALVELIQGSTLLDPEQRACAAGVDFLKRLQAIR